MYMSANWIMRQTLIGAGLTHGRAWIVFFGFRNHVFIHPFCIPVFPSPDVLGSYRVSSHFEGKFSFVCLDFFSVLPLPHNGFHLIWLDILIQTPLADDVSILSNALKFSVCYSVLAERKLTSLRIQ